MFVLCEFLGCISFIDPILFLHGSVHVLEVSFGQFVIFSARHQLDTWTLALPEDMWYGVILWLVSIKHGLRTADWV